MKPTDVELHDATIDSLSIDYVKKSVSLRVAFYPDAIRSSKRVPATIAFSGVERLSSIAEFLELTNHRVAGNVVYWHPAVGAGTTNIYLTGGLLAITAKSVKFRVEKES